MIWDQIFAGILLVLQSEFAIMQFHRLGISPIAAFLITACCTNFRVLFIFTFVGIIDWLTLRFGKNHLYLREMMGGLPWLRRIDESLKNGKKRMLVWLIEHNKLIIFLILFIPFIPFGQDIAIVAAKIARIKGAFSLMMIATTARVALVTFAVYHVF